MGTTTTFYTQNLSDGQEVWGTTSHKYIGALRFGYPNRTTTWLAYRVLPGISQVGQRVVVSSATSSVTASATSGPGAFTAQVGVHDGTVPDLSAASWAFTYTSLGSLVDISVPSGRSIGAVLNASLQTAVQAWFDRSAYASTDYMGIIWQDGDSAKNEYWYTYASDESTVSVRNRLALTYHIASKAKWNSTANKNLKRNGVSSNNLSRLQ